MAEDSATSKAAVPMLRDFFGLHLLPWRDYLGIALLVAVWTVIVRWAWQSCAFDRFFGYHLAPAPASKG